MGWIDLDFIRFMKIRNFIRLINLPPLATNSVACTDNNSYIRMGNTRLWFSRPRSTYRLDIAMTGGRRGVGRGRGRRMIVALGPRGINRSLIVPRPEAEGSASVIHPSSHNETNNPFVVLCTRFEAGIMDKQMCDVDWRLIKLAVKK